MKVCQTAHHKFNPVLPLFLSPSVPKHRVTYAPKGSHYNGSLSPSERPPIELHLWDSYLKCTMMIMMIMIMIGEYRMLRTE